MIALLLLATLSDSLQCPAYPGDPPWRVITCRIEAQMGYPPTREWRPGPEPIWIRGEESHEGEGEA